MKNFSRHLYLILLAMSCTAMTVAGLCALPASGERYGEQPALAATAINQIKQFCAPAEEMPIDLEEIERASYATRGDDPYGLSNSKREVFQTESARKEQIELEKRERKGEDNTSSSEKPAKTGKKKKEKQQDSAAMVSKKGYSFRNVGENYFNDALFIGDSRQQGFGLYSQLENITVYAQKGYQIVSAATKPIVETPFGKITLTDALAINQHRFKKVYIMFGLNEMTGGNRDLSSYYYNLIDYIKLTQPDAVIYLESILHVSASTAKKRPALSNDKIDEQNEILKKIAATENIVFLDLNEIMTDETGALFSDAASDGIHLKSSYILKWKNYLMSHAVSQTKNAAADELPYIELTPQQQLLKDQLDAYYGAITESENGDDNPEDIDSAEGD